jgi:hypothetical protein
MKLISGFLLFLAAFSSTSSASEDALRSAVAFALTGSDAAKLNIINRANCVFSIKEPGNAEEKVYYLNNVETDRIKFWKLENNLGTQFSKVELHGSKIIVRHIYGSKLVDLLDDAFRKNGQEPVRRDQLDPKLLQDETIVLNDYTVEFATTEHDRVSQAWSYIYTNGCTGKKSAF